MAKKVRNNRFCFKINRIEKKSFQLPEIKLNLEVKSLINSSGLDCDLNRLLYCSFQRAISGNYPKYIEQNAYLFGALACH